MLRMHAITKVDLFWHDMCCILTCARNASLLCTEATDSNILSHQAFGSINYQGIKNYHAALVSRSLP